MQILDGKLVAKEILDTVAVEVRSLTVPPRLVVVLVGDNPASETYVRMKRKACEQVGIVWELIRLSAGDVTTESVIDLIHELNQRDDVHGILVQLPLPSHVYVPQVIKAIDPYKDVDGFQAYNLGKMFLSEEFMDLSPCTPKGVLKILDHYNIDVKGMDATVVGHSNVVGKPMSTMLLNRNATVTTCHIDTKDLKSHTIGADLLVVAVGKPGLVTADMVKDGAIVIDVGINKLADGKLVGDVDFENVSKKASYITPVPGGVGPMTVACLMENTLMAYKKNTVKK
ncbi:bifunctional methylenetetrahydrofolate dehydrogenase/methenyltetrahydrofolate cyclohydrolase [Candidatus Peregrinibacteria bacterium CG22_combo_CG10-13_8_21_14_all_44_10]|nr:MAG: bifunctional methylenetetrahydrofolate dehydrogenase/methenyltetrahydrofolate cyclohydrolase [Candidatus Peregrinibacteria bacterium CG2_30_44_17]PIP66633.1 MAG: bifunctional methylenetetrahydrofolate dehydrogenase/methenyltetrahydrofolate cyclohydrolase [Candidatus Peregrinibacteria bacterium CG22_combo_CG10-13_8_21_14_all_44_10]PIS03783.1 MAG: bifunctional methylenetetrahydrofolate dehydrogenase/methenyltetrahydrofolate cyclohydrolase [Candidatus Peregrinibacteria bacterium CG10_big_fil